jgi:tol-pal system protein YbgF
MFKYVFITIFTFFLLTACGGSRQGGGDGLTEEEKQQQENLSEIESLLGISGTGSETTQSQTQQKPSTTSAQNDDMLGLLGANERIDDSQPGAQPPVDNAKVKSIEKEVTNLKSQVREKDMIIADLKAQIDFQNEQLEKQSTHGSIASSASFSGPIGDVAPGEYQQRYQEALDSFHGHNYNQAIEQFESLLASSSTNSLSDNAQYWIGESWYAQGKYDTAIAAFHKVFTFPKSNKNPDAQFKLGLCYIRKGDNTKAREEFQRLLDLYPNSDYTKRAQSHLSSL